MSREQRIPVGIWVESNPGDQWAHQGMTRLLGFIIEGIAQGGVYQIRLSLPDYTRPEAEEDLKSLNAKEGVDYALYSPKDFNEEVNSFEELAMFANRHVKVDGWLSLFPQYTHATYLDAPVTVIFPDAIPLVFPDYAEASWGHKGHHVAWRERVGDLLTKVDRVITFSDHVARDHVNKLFNYDVSKLRPILVAPPDLSPLLPYVRDHKRTSDSLKQAAEDLRRHALAHGSPYFEDYPFENSPYVAISTQDRVTKNLRIVADAVSRVVRDDRANLKMLMTAHLVFGTYGSPLPYFVEDAQLHRDIISMPDLPRAVHAAFYHAAELAIHPSIFEGGAGTFPFLEAASVGTPCLMADGPHQREINLQAPRLAKFVFDPNDTDGLIKLIRMVRDNRAEIVEEQASIYQQLRQRSWQDVAMEYARAATENNKQVKLKAQRARDSKTKMRIADPKIR